MTAKLPIRRSERALTLAPIGGNVVLLTQLYWPTVHPALQEPRRTREETS